ncbi:hypothetical protein P280DRAFT_459265 [Massarina eburnea CBS 473.64]|uniref:Uncharacterized protein n=1 Tax=Massarina eburnea CBS 473.64 TaxID=1395130 RepID=A0A6A6RNN0_9PLEO|nr:hypothetical protein P280DRAFT_459265 [Massarina eburnea CBS 473.64]
MPRPRKAKVASSTGRVAKTGKTTKAAPRKQQPTKATAENFSDDSDGLVVKASAPQERMPWQPEPQKDADFTMTGALPASSSKLRTPLHNASRRTRTSKASAAASSPRKTPASSASRQSRSARVSAHESPAQDEGSSGFGDHMLSFSSLDSDSPAHGTRPPSAIKVGATPAHESSIFALTNFKRRPRQHSLLRMVQQTTDVEDNDEDDFEFDDFLPEAESTPLHPQRSTSGNPTGNDSGVNLSSSGSRGTKRKLSPVILVPQSPPRDDSSADVGASRSPTPSLPEIIPSTEEAQAVSRDEEEPLSETMAPPMSSSDYEVDEIEGPLESPVGRRQRRTRGTSAKAAESESEGEETDRPRKAKPKSNGNRGISTAKLQALLPRRRMRMQQEDEYDVPSGDSDEDELALPQRRQPAAGRKPAAPKATKKPARAAKKTTVKPARKNTRTYGRRPSSDKENEEARQDTDSDEMGDTIAAAAGKHSKRLEAMAKKFEEVDDFELDFESVSYATSSPLG